MNVNKYKNIEKVAECIYLAPKSNNSSFSECLRVNRTKNTLPFGKHIEIIGCSLLCVIFFLWAVSYEFISINLDIQHSIYKIAGYQIMAYLFLCFSIAYGTILKNIIPLK